MNMTVRPAFLQGKIDIIPSKSHLHRLLIASALCGSDTFISGSSDAKDIDATVQCLNALGANIRREANGFCVSPIAFKGEATLDCGESGSTLRFLLPVAAALGGKYVFTGKGRLSERPISELSDALFQGGVKVSSSWPYTLEGKLKSVEYKVRADISSQYITGLLFALPLLENDSHIITEGAEVSSGYTAITIDVLKAFSVRIEKTSYGYFVKGGQKYISPKHMKAEGDWSNAAFWLCAGAINGDITVSGLHLSSFQGDKAILSLLKEMGADISVSESSVRVKKSNLTAVEIDAENIPDLVPVLAATAAYAKGTTIIKNVSRLRLKESDRIETVMSLLSALGIRSEYNGSLYIIGGKVYGGSINGANDHRIVMSAFVAALGAEGLVTITDTEAAGKSYPAFIEEYKRLGGNADASL